jgi:hypothetical protein
MKWNEPWVDMLRRQGTFNPFTKRELKSGVIWTGMLLTVGTMTAFTSDQPMIEVVERAPVAIMIGFALSLLISFLHWVSQQSISSGPKGIVRSKGEMHTLIPWSTVQQHRFSKRDTAPVLELIVSYQLEPEILYLPSRGADIKKISDEIERMTMNVD